MKNQKDIDNATKNLKYSQIRNKEDFLRRFHKRIQRYTFQVNDLVLKRNSPMKMALNHHKYEPKYLGPYKIAKITTHNNFLLAELNGAVMDKPTAAFRVIPFYERTTDLMNDIFNESDNDTDLSSEED